MSAVPNLSRTRIKTPSQQPVLLEHFPRVPDDVKKRFPSMEKYQGDMKEWIRKANSQVGNLPT